MDHQGFGPLAEIVEAVGALDCVGQRGDVRVEGSDAGTERAEQLNKATADHTKAVDADSQSVQRSRPRRVVTPVAGLLCPPNPDHVVHTGEQERHCRFGDTRRRQVTPVRNRYAGLDQFTRHAVANRPRVAADVAQSPRIGGKVDGEQTRVPTGDRHAVRADQFRRRFVTEFRAVLVERQRPDRLDCLDECWRPDLVEPRPAGEVHDAGSHGAPFTSAAARTVPSGL